MCIPKFWPLSKIVCFSEIIKVESNFLKKCQNSELILWNALIYPKANDA